MIGRYSDICIHGFEDGKCEQCYELWKDGAPSESLIDYSHREKVKKEDRERYLKKLGVTETKSN